MATRIISSRRPAKPTPSPSPALPPLVTTLTVEQLRAAAVALCEKCGRSVDPLLQYRLAEEALSLWDAAKALHAAQLQHGGRS